MTQSPTLFSDDMAEPRKSYRCCFVPHCRNTTTKNPEKLFYNYPKDPELFKKWCTAAGRGSILKISPETTFVCCEDHFDEGDVENIMEYKMGFDSKLFLKKDAIPHIFTCQGGKTMTRKKLHKTSVIKRKQKRLIENVLGNQLKESNEENHGNTSLTDIIGPKLSSYEEDPMESSRDFSCQTNRRIHYSTMSWSEGEILSLIELVKCDLSLYDISRPENKDWSNIKSTWNKIGRKLGRKGIQAKSMWSHMTRTYMWLKQSKDYNPTEEGGWPYMEAMSFLSPFVEEVKEDPREEELVDYDATIESGIPVPAYIIKAKDEKQILYDPLQNLLQSDESFSGIPNCEDKETPEDAIPLLNGLARKKKMDVDDAMCQYLKAKIMRPKDPNQLFLTSVAHDMRLLSDSDQVLFKMKVQQLLVEMICKEK